MTPKKYSERKREEKQTAKSETLGVTLIIASAFFLLCLITRNLVLGDVGKALANLLLGFFGLSAYAIFLFTLFYGVLKVKKRSVSVRKKYIVGIVLIAVFVLLTANLASSARFLDNGFSSYISESYKAKNTVGGILIGFANYLFYAVFGSVLCYIIFSLAIIGSFLLMTGFLKDLSVPAKKRVVKKSSLKKSNAYSENGSFASSNNGGLFVGTIIPRNDRVSVYGSFDDMLETGKIDLTNAPEELKDKIYNYENAKKILFTDNKVAFEQFLPNTQVAEPRQSVSEIKEENSPILEIHMPPPKNFEHRFVEGEIINGDAVEEKAAEDRLIDEKMGKEVPPVNKPDFIPFPDIIEETQKPSVPYFNPAPIINGDFYEVGKEVKYTEPYAPIEVPPVYNELSFDEPQKDVAYQDEPVADVCEQEDYLENEEQDFAVYDIPEQEEFVENSEEDETHFEDFGVVENEQSNEEPVDLLNNEPFFELDDASAIGSLEGGSDEAIVEIEQDEDVKSELDEVLPADELIVNEEDLLSIPEEPSEPSFIENYSAEPEIAPREEFPTEEEKRSKAFEETTTSFKIINEVEDLSERGFENPNDTTGYYNKVSAPIAPKPTFEKKVTAIDNKINRNNKQIDIDTYAQHSAEKKVTEQPKPTPKPVKPKKYVAPPLDLLTTESGKPETDDAETQVKIGLLENVLEEMGVPAKVNHVTVGPSVTRYELDMPPGISVKKVETLSADIRYNLASKGKIRIETPIPGKRAVGIELPNDTRTVVALRDIIDSKEFKSSSSPLTVALGKDIQGSVMLTRLDKLPHVLVAGATGMGKSCGLNSLLVSLIYKASPQDVKFILIDPKRVEFSAYSGLPHMMIPDAITDVDQAVNAFKWVYDEMERRYVVLQQNQVRNIGEYNDMPEVKEGAVPKMPFIVMVVDEFANLITSSKATRKTLEDIIMAIASKARAAGIHLVLATQRPSVDVITGTIKANLPSRIAFAVTSIADSRTILDNAGAELLLGKGDMLFAPVDASEEVRIQGALVENLEVKNIVSFVKEHNQCDFNEEFGNAIAKKEQSSSAGGNNADMPTDDNDLDEELSEVARCIIRANQASASMIQRRFRCGWNKAARFMDQLEELKFIGPAEGSKPREVLATKEMFFEVFGEEYE